MQEVSCRICNLSRSLAIARKADRTEHNIRCSYAAVVSNSHGQLGDHGHSRRAIVGGSLIQYVLMHSLVYTQGFSCTSFMHRIESSSISRKLVEKL